MKQESHLAILASLVKSSRERQFLYIHRFKEVESSAEFTPEEKAELCNLLDGMIQEVAENMADLAFFQGDNAARLDRQPVLCYGNGKTFRL